jgi:hypothetical protein
MNEHTPETLRELANLIAAAHPDRTDAYKVRAHVDAWKEREKYIEALERIKNASGRFIEQAVSVKWRGISPPLGESPHTSIDQAFRELQAALREAEDG